MRNFRNQSDEQAPNGSNDKLTRRLYALYIELMQSVADIAQVDIDVWSMPTAEQIGLPMRGTMGFTVNLGNPTISAELTFESSPAELVGSMTGIAAVGVMAAIAMLRISRSVRTCRNTCNWCPSSRSPG